MAVTDVNGNKLWEGDYTPFGQRILSTEDKEDFARFTGKDYDEDTGLYYFNARWYDSEMGRFVTEDPAADPNNPNLYTYSRNNPLIFVDPTGLWTYEIDEETGDWYAVAEEKDTLSGLSKDVYGTSRYVDELQEDNEIEDPKTIQVGQRVKMGNYNKEGRIAHGQILKAGYMCGDVSYETLRGQGFQIWDLMNEEEKEYMTAYYKILDKLYKSGDVTKEKYNKEMRRLESQDGKAVKGYLYDRAYGNTSATYDETYLLGAYLGFRLIRIIGPAIASSPFVQKMIGNGPEAKEVVSNKGGKVLAVCKNGVFYRDAVTGRFALNPFKHLHTSLGEQKAWSSMLELMNEWNVAFRSSREAQSILEALEAGLKMKLRGQ